MSGDHAEWPQAFLGKPYQLKGLNDVIRRALAARQSKDALLKNLGEAMY
ncbi:MAG: hypothetical protein HY881_13670 [Deltaproteobacteria bacterium]|nr:hypothetical protein [Deltaproteobacteria bacterium]